MYILCLAYIISSSHSIYIQRTGIMVTKSVLQILIKITARKCPWTCGRVIWCTESLLQQHSFCTTLGTCKVHFYTRKEISVTFFSSLTVLEKSTCSAIMTLTVDLKITHKPFSWTSFLDPCFNWVWWISLKSFYMLHGTHFFKQPRDLWPQDHLWQVKLTLL